jgi:hypothetical protein
MPWWSQITPVLAALSPIAGLVGVWLGLWIARRNTHDQWLKDQKLKVYGDVLRAMNGYSAWFLDAKEEIKFGSEANEHWKNLNKQNQQIIAEFHAAYAVAPLFVNRKSSALIERAKPVFYAHLGSLSQFDNLDAMDRCCDLLKEIRGELVACAKSDLDGK